MRRTLLHWVSGSLAFLLACEVAFQVLPVSSSTRTAYYLDPLILSYPPNHRWTTATGWDLRNPYHQRSNNLGFLADRDFEPNSDAVALIGDSYVEASMLPAEARPAAQLERALDGRPVFALGGPGSALLDYAERVRYAVEHFGVRDVVVFMEPGDVRQSLCGSGNIHGPCIDSKTLAPRTETQPDASMGKRLLRHSGLAQYLFSQLKFEPGRFIRQAILQSRPASGPPTGPATRHQRPAESPSVFLQAQQDAVTAAFRDKVRGYITGELIIVIDAHRAGLYAGDSGTDSARDDFIDKMRASGAKVVDAAPIFRDQLARSRRSLSVGPYDAHLNVLGVQLLMNAAAVELGGREEKSN